MDTIKTITHIGLCAGYGGIELGLNRVITNLRSVALCEIEAFACANLVAKMEAGIMDPAPIWTDLKTFPWAEFRDRVDILTGGYPCQPFSAAGLRRGKDDPRHLWPWIADGIRLMRPGRCFFENVEGHISMGLPDVIEDLVGMGYRVSWGIFSAAEVGAPHQRKRVFILADCNSKGLEGWLSGSVQERAGQRDSGKVRAWPSRPGEPQHEWEPPRVTGESKRLAPPHCGRGKESEQKQANLPPEPSWGNAEAVGIAEGRTRLGSAQWQAGHATQSDEAMGNTNSERSQKWPGPGGSAVQGADSDGREITDREAESSLGGNPDGPACGLDYAELCVACDNRTDELRLLGNGVVPATAEKAFRVLFKKLNETPKDSGVAD